MAKHLHLYDPPAPQPIAQPAEDPRPLLQQGCVQDCEGFLSRQSKILKRWKTDWLEVIAGEQINTGIETAQVGPVLTRPLLRHWF